MKKIFLLPALLAIACPILGSDAWAQSDQEEFVLEDIIVTAEKRDVEIQDLPASVSVLKGDDLITQGRITIEEIFKDVPNLKYRYGDVLSPLGNIAVRGIQRTQDFRGVDQALPSTTAAYVDGIYQGIGGNYDINRVEILRGPQGTLYGRSATGGVVSFHTNDPNLDEFGGNVTAEFGSDALINWQAALNVPVGEKFAIRVAGHYYSRDGYFAPEGGQTETKEGRIKFLFKPSDAFDIVLHASMQETTYWGGGWKQKTERDDPSGNTYVLQAEWSGEPGANPPQEYSQFGVTANYDFGDLILTWVGGYHTFDQTGSGVEEGQTRGGVTSYRRTDMLWPENWYNYQEVRLASDTEGWFTWLMGLTFFHQEYTRDTTNWQTRVENDPELDPNNSTAIDMHEWQSGEFLNVGYFTEETFAITDKLNITAGLRYDYTEFINNIERTENMGKTMAGSYLPESETNPYVSASQYGDFHDWDNITYKLRVDYELTPESMIYFTTATGFVPGFSTLGPRKVFDPAVGRDVLVGYDLRIMDEQKLTNYEIGTKNLFLDNRLRVNASGFFYDVEGYPQVYELSTAPGPAQKVMTSTPIEVYGVDLEVEYLPTAHDKIQLAAGYQNPKLTGHTGDIMEWPFRPGSPEYDEFGPVVYTDADDACILRTQPGHPKFQASLGYEHTFILANGSTLVPRAQIDYTGSYNLEQMNWLQERWGAGPYNHQDAYWLCNANIVWTSPNQNYSVNLWVRNAFDELYKSGPQRFGLMTVYFPGEDIPVGLGAPRTFGMSVSARF